ncbi:DUF4062 domain-containing protein [Roseivirga sp. BDSF3-8]|uniref:STAND family AAA ATPase n=1 Tax=Roseivirga sp. BDSF3-8 TaxID=3241598 RepID=UPI00353234B9
MKDIKEIKVFIASPSDVQKEREICQKEIDRLNKTQGSQEGFNIKLLKWEDTRPSTGEYAQGEINKQIGTDYDIFIGIMWLKFGSPTKNAGSGTEEEFNIAYQNFLKGSDITIMFYFSEVPSNPSNIDLEQFSKVKEFQKTVGSYGSLYKPYSSLADFKDLVHDHLYLAISEKLKNKEQETKSKDTANELENDEITFEFTEKFENHLNNVGTKFSHSNVETVTLDDIYCPPDLKTFDSKENTGYKTKNTDEIASTFPSDNSGFKYVILGKQLSGKTSIAKYLTKEYFNYSYLPILLSGRDFTNNLRIETIIKILEKKVKEQYKEPFLINAKNKNELIFVIDDYDKATKGEIKFWHALNNNLNKISPNIVLLGNSLMLMENFGSKDPFANYEKLGILEFGPILRKELVDKWNKLGAEDNFIDRNEVLRKNDAALDYIKTIIGKNYVPSYPLYLLTILQAYEGNVVNNTNYSLHGFYFELLINDALNTAVKDKKDISLYHNFMTELCFNMFQLQTKEVSYDTFDNFFILFCKRYDIETSFKTTLKTLENANLLIVNNGIQVPENYIYYFFVAKYIANNIYKKEIKLIISKLAERIFRKEFANILMFLTHLSKDEYIIKILIEQSSNLFKEFSPTKLSSDIEQINKLVESIPDQILDHIDVDQARIEELENEEEQELLEKELQNHKSQYDEFQLDDNIENLDFIARLSRAMKAIDLLGQVVKKHWGELDGETKEVLITETYMIGLRTLSFYINTLASNSESIADIIEEQVSRKHIKDRHVLKESVQQLTKETLFNFSFLATWGTINRVSNAVGLDKLDPTLKKVLSKNNYNSVKLIDFSTKLKYKNINLTTVDKYHEEMKDNKLCHMLLQNLVIDYLYMFNISFKEKSQLCAKLGISMQDQRYISGSSKVKKK